MIKKVHDFFFDVEYEEKWHVSDKICIVVGIATVAFATYAALIGWGIL